MSERLPNASNGESALAIVCGGGSLPFALADAAIAARPPGGAVRAPRIGRSRSASPPIRTTGPGWASSDRFMQIAETEGCRDVVFIGSVTRPSLWTIRPDWRALRLMPQIVRLYRGGDDHLQSGIGRLFEQHGFRLLGPHDIAPELTMPLGPLGSRVPVRARPRRHRARACAARRHEPLRHRPGGGRRRQSCARGRRARGHRPDAGARRGFATRAAASARRPASACW